MAANTWALPVPAEGFAVTSLVIEGSGKDVEMHLRRNGRPTLALPVSDVRVTVTDEVVLDISRVDDASLALTYSAPGLLVTGARISWEDDEWTPGLAEELSTLFSDAPNSSEKRRELSYCVHVEISLASQPHHRP